MSLTASFNKSFLKENIKKSKGTVIFSIIIIPILTAIMMLIGYSSNSSITIFTWDEYSVFNIIFLFILPFVFSKIFFGFVYDRKSVDFINSMPVNRKTIFVTNTIGGIGLITIIQLLTALVLVLCNCMSRVVILPQMMIDSLIAMWLSYVFIFVVANLAMTVAGTYMTQTVIAALILFLVPFCVDCFTGMEWKNRVYSENEFTITDGTIEVGADVVTNQRNYTMPYKIIRYMGNISQIISMGTLVRMGVLSIGYIWLGLKLFEKRKMENCESSFLTIKGHLTLKTITLIPILVFANLFGTIIDSFSYATTILVALAIYYFVYDFIVKRKVPFKTSVTSFFSSIIILQIAIIGVNSISSKINKRELDINDVKSISFGKDVTSRYYSIYNNNDDFILNNTYFFKDQELIEWIFDASSKINTIDSYNSKYDNYTYQYDYNVKSIPVNLKTKFGKVYSLYIYLNQEDIDELYEMVLSDEKYANNIRKEISSSNGVALNKSELVDSKNYKKINNILKNDIDVEMLHTNSTLNEDYIEKYYYNNHKLKMYYIPINISEDLISIVAEEENKYVKECFKKIKNLKKYWNYNFECNMNDETYSFYNDDKVIEFIEENLSEEFDANEPYIIIKGTLFYKGDYRYIRFYTNNIKGVKNIIRTSDVF